MKVEQRLAGSEFDCRRIPEGGEKVGVIAEDRSPDGIHEAVKLCSFLAKT